MLSHTNAVLMKVCVNVASSSSSSAVDELVNNAGMLPRCWCLSLSCCTAVGQILLVQSHRFLQRIMKHLQSRETCKNFNVTHDCRNFTALPLSSFCLTHFTSSFLLFLSFFLLFCLSSLLCLHFVSNPDLLLRQAQFLSDQSYLFGCFTQRRRRF